MPLRLVGVELVCAKILQSTLPIFVVQLPCPMPLLILCAKSPHPFRSILRGVSKFCQFHGSGLAPAGLSHLFPVCMYWFGQSRTLVPATLKMVLMVDASMSNNSLALTANLLMKKCKIQDCNPDEAYGDAEEVV